MRRRPVGACSGMPRPSGAGATCQPRLSRGIGGWASRRCSPSVRAALGWVLVRHASNATRPAREHDRLPAPRLACAHPTGGDTDVQERARGSRREAQRPRRDRAGLAPGRAGGQADARCTCARVELHPFRPLSPALLADERESSQKLLEQERAAAEVEAELRRAWRPARPARACTSRPRRGGRPARRRLLRPRRIGRVMLGDDTRAALNGAPCAVAVAPRGYGEAPLPLARIGVAYNGSPESVAALAEARELAAPQPRRDPALEVVALPTYAFTGLVPPAFGETIELMLSEANARLGEIEGVQGRAVVRARRRGARRVRRRGGPAGGRLAQLRPGQAAGARQHLRLPRAPRAQLAARAAAPARPAAAATAAAHGREG